MKPIGSNIFGGQLVGRSLVEGGELRTSVDGNLDGARRHVADGHVVDQTLPQRRHRVLGHRRTPASWTARTGNPDRTLAADEPSRTGSHVGEVILCDVAGMALLTRSPPFAAAALAYQKHRTRKRRIKTKRSETFATCYNVEGWRYRD